MSTALGLLFDLLVLIVAVWRALAEEDVKRGDLMAEEKRKKGDGDEKKRGDGDKSETKRGVPITAQIVNNLADTIDSAMSGSRARAAAAIRTLQEDGVIGRAFSATEEAVLRRAEGK